MNTLLRPVFAYLSDTWQAFWRGWDHFWFAPADPATLAVVRIVTGLTVLYTHVTTLPDVMEFIGPNAWIDSQAVDEIRSMAFDPSDPGGMTLRAGACSIYYYLHDVTHVWMVYGLFLVAAACFTAGFFSRIASVLVWAGHISYVVRGEVIFFGMDSILALLTLYLMFGPTGAEYSVDAWLRRRQKRLAQPPSHVPHADLPPPSVAANFVCRLLQIHMCIIYLAAGFAKLTGATWWNGMAIYMTMLAPGFAFTDMTWLGKYDWLWMSVSNLGGFFTLFTEIGFAFLVWHPRLKPIILACTFMLQFGIGVFMGLGAFQAAMFAGCLAFISPKSMRWFLATALKRPSLDPAPTGHKLTTA